jgi:hypothetical protein
VCAIAQVRPREGATDLRLGRAVAGQRRMGPVYSGAMADCNEAIRPLHDRMPVLLHPDEYEQWLRGSFEDLVAFQKRCFPDDLIEIQPTSELWVKKKAPASSAASLLSRTLEVSERLEKRGSSTVSISNGSQRHARPLPGPSPATAVPLPSPPRPLKRRCSWSRRRYFAEAGKTGSLSRSRASCWMMTVALAPATIFLTRSSDARVWARSVLNAVTPLVS